MKRLPLLLLVLLTSACSSIPNSGPVVEGPRVDVVRNDGYVRVIARPPVPGMTPDAIVRGFLAASASVADGDETARLYLTDEASKDWNPQRLTVVYDAAALKIASDRGDVVEIAAPKIGSIDALHRYTAADVGASISDTLRLRKVSGEWRIDSPPRALYLGEGDVARSFRPHPVFFFNAAFSRLVPEFVLLPLGIGSVPTQVVTALLVGPNTVYGTALTSAIPSGTDLSYRLVNVESGTATVALDRRVLNTTPEQRDAIMAQLVWTLTSLNDISLVRVTVEGEPFAVPSGRSSYARADYAEVGPEDAAPDGNLVYVRGDRVLQYKDGKWVVVSRGVPPSAAALSRSGGLLAVIPKDRKLVYISKTGSAARPLAAGSDLARPLWQPDDRLWFVDREVNGGLRTWDEKNGIIRVRTDLPPGARILDFGIAPDHTRIAVIVTDGVTASLRVGLIENSPTGARLVGLQRVEQRLAAISAVAWETTTQLVVLASAGAVPLQPIRVTLPTGTITLLGGPANPVSISAAPGSPIVVGDEAGQLWEYSGGRWTASVLGNAPNYIP